jgi:ribosomal protein S18 acetylase RimI-like enzyme
LKKQFNKPIEILSIEFCNGCIVMRNRNEGQVVRLFYNQVDNKMFISKSEFRFPPFICINRLYVDFNYRKIGWANVVMNLLIERFKGHSFLVNAFSDDKEYMSNETLIKFYNSFGFKFLKLSEEGVILIKEKTS